MPAYDYVCDACDHRFEKFQRYSEDPISTCPECGQNRCRRLISAPGVVFKGSGWYINDTRSLKQPKNGRSTSGDDSGGNGAGEQAGDSKIDSSASDSSSGAGESGSGGGEPKVSTGDATSKSTDKAKPSGKTSGKASSKASNG